MSEHAPSYWAATAGPEPAGVIPLAGNRTAEVAVIGGGFTGLATAHRLAAVHGVDTVLLEDHRIGWGASGRNAGFAMIGLGKLSLEAKVRAWGADATRRSLQIAIEAVDTVTSLLHDEGIDALPQARGWVEVAHRPSRTRELAAHAARYRALLGRADAVEVLDRAALDARGLMRGPAAHGALRFDDAFGLHPLRYARGLAAAAVRRGAALHDGSRVVGWTREGGWHLLATDGGTVRARRVVMATNGYTPETLHPFFAGRTLPAASNILVTPPLTAAQWEAAGVATTQVYTDTRKLVLYWRRLPDGRLLFGGRGGLRDTPATLVARRRWLRGRMAEKFPHLADVPIDYFWYGYVCLPFDRTPHLHAVDGDPSVAYAMGYTGTGVALATWSGQRLADLVATGSLRRDTPLTATPLPRFPFPALRRLYLAGAYALFGLSDRRP
jgi:glycine/D-amino acid oxidase-like deaminating enzyme